MGWARTLFLGDIGNRLDIADTERDIDSLRESLDQAWEEVASSRAADQSQDETIRTLRREIDQLELCVTMLVRLLRTRGVVTSAELDRIVNLIDD